MPYRITYARSLRTTTEHWRDSLEEAQIKATECVICGAADYVEIRTLDGKFVDAYPATSRESFAN